MYVVTEMPEPVAPDEGIAFVPYLVGMKYPRKFRPGTPDLKWFSRKFPSFRAPLAVGLAGRGLLALCYTI